jgi:hypothetical protein
MLIVAGEPRGSALAGIDRLAWLMVTLGAIALAIVLSRDRLDPQDPDPQPRVPSVAERRC